jgi:hypothetical protein
MFVSANSSFVWTVYYTQILFSSILLSTNSNHVSLTSSEPNTGQFPSPSVITAPLFVTACGCYTGNFLLTNRYAALCSVPVSHTLPASGKLCDKPQVESRSVAARTVNLGDVCVAQHVGKFLTGWGTGSFSRSTPLHVQVVAPSGIFRWRQHCLNTHSLSFSLLLLVFHTLGTDVYCRPTAPPPPN